MSLFAIGGANAPCPEMHRLAVEVQGWMTDRQFADMFAIAQVTPGPNVIIVTLIGYHVAGLPGAGRDPGDVRADLRVRLYVGARVGPLQGRAVADRDPGGSWFPISIGLIAASAFVVGVHGPQFGRSGDHGWHRGRTY